jgi:hypothetical protein
MDLLEMLMGSGKSREEYEDFAKRFDQAPPWDGYSDQQVLDRYGSVAHNVPQTDYKQAAREAFARLSPEQRAEFAQELQIAFVPFAEGCWHDIESDYTVVAPVVVEIRIFDIHA